MSNIGNGVPYLQYIDFSANTMPDYNELGRVDDESDLVVLPSSLVIGATNDINAAYVRMDISH